MNIVIGQYLPGNSLLHRADPRTKLLLTLVFMVLVILLDSFVGYGITALFLLLVVLTSRISLKYVWKSVKPILVLLLFTIVLNVLFYRGEELLFQWWIVRVYWEGVLFSVKMALRIVMIVVGASLLTYTTTSILLTDGLEKLMSPLAVLGFPAHDVAMMMSIALRFIPTFVEETDRIMKAQAARGSDFGSGSLREKIKGFVPILIPLFVSAFRRAEDLATAMEARCYRGGKGRTRFRVLCFGKADALVCVAFLGYTALLVLERIFL